MTSPDPTMSPESEPVLTATGSALASRLYGLAPNGTDWATIVASVEDAARVAESPVQPVLSGLEVALEAEWYNGNLDERAYRRLCQAAGVKPYPSAIARRLATAPAADEGRERTAQEIHDEDGTDVRHRPGNCRFCDARRSAATAPAADEGARLRRIEEAAKRLTGLMPIDVRLTELRAALANPATHEPWEDR